MFMTKEDACLVKQKQLMEKKYDINGTEYIVNISEASMDKAK